MLKYYCLALVRVHRWLNSLFRKYGWSNKVIYYIILFFYLATEIHLCKQISSLHCNTNTTLILTFNLKLLDTCVANTRKSVVNAVPSEPTILHLSWQIHVDSFVLVYNTNDTSERGDLPVRTFASPAPECAGVCDVTGYFQLSHT